MLLAPLVRGRKGQHKDVFAAVRKAGFVRVRVDGEVLDVDSVPASWRRARTITIEAVVDRIVVREGVDARLAESIDLAVAHGEGAVLVSYLEPGDGRRRAAAGRLARAALQHALRLPELQDQLRGAGAAHVQLQQPLRRLPGVRRAWARGSQFDPGAGAARRRACRWPTGRSRPGRATRRPKRGSTRRSCADFLEAAGVDWNDAAGRVEAASAASNCCTATAATSPACWRCWNRNTSPTTRAGAARAARSLSRRGRLPGVRRRAAAARGPRRAGSAAGRFTKSRP